MKNDRFLKALRGEQLRPIPIWIMRQAGRYLPEYQEVRGKTDFLTLCKTPELAAQVTIQPVDVLGVDAAILFSDILIPLEPMGIGLDFKEGHGPVLSPPVRTEADVSRLVVHDPNETCGFVSETVKILRKELSQKVPLIGFSGAPFTLATYMIEGGSSRNFLFTKKMMFEAPDLFNKLMEKITDVTIRYLSMQINSGAEAIQVFDTWAGILSVNDYFQHVFPHVDRIFKELSTFDCPKIYFAFGGHHLLSTIKDLKVDCFGIDWRTPLNKASDLLGNDKVVQGNLDPLALFLPEKDLRDRVKVILEEGKVAKSHIFNLGHGVLPQIPAEKVKLLVEIVHDLSK
ncbi:Uroporphyrinogen III decarboxylase [Dissulfuribacter thermophilus]|uniref:Uroporphyrinogen decarboxylase n=1 Tax=Dissulfuribacter thermophilus TaxID=1156395 RepID=A0A1B9F5P3_9BACT|nr:uroporphyrinogen decarboxylase [Dissulfuribacter thermophilus]OCC15230.1 Uroporphyrinogen III decarboxylase [Dissulfuribacter thermophilus]